jgi:hypothetical protein
MLSGEYALCIGGYVLAFEIFARGDSVLRRAVGVIPFALPACAYLVVRRVWGYGAVGSGFYTDPFHDPVAYLRHVPWRVSALLGDAWISPNFDSLRPRAVVYPALAVALALLWVPLRRTFASLAPEGKRATAFMIAGSVLSLLPVVSVVPSARLLGAAMLGVAAGLASILDRVWFGSPFLPGVRRSRAEAFTAMIALGLAFEHIVRGPVLGLVTGRAVTGRAVAFAEHAEFLHQQLTDPARQRLIVVRATEEVFFQPFIMAVKGFSVPRLVALTDASHVLLLSKDLRTLTAIVPSDKSLVYEGEGSLFRDDAALRRKGSWVSINGVRATVLETGEAGPTQARIAFDEDYDSQSFVWVTTGSKSLRTVEPPQPGFGEPVDP